jgi:hypothetical protein
LCSFLGFLTTLPSPGEVIATRFSPTVDSDKSASVLATGVYGKEHLPC